MNQNDPSETALQRLKEAIYYARTQSLADVVVVIHPLHDLVDGEIQYMFAVGSENDQQALIAVASLAGLQEYRRSLERGLRRNEILTPSRQAILEKMERLEEEWDSLLAELAASVQETDPPCV